MKYPKLERTVGNVHHFIHSTGQYIHVTTEQIQGMLDQVTPAKPAPKPRSTKSKASVESAE